jgi:PAS domain S-box-containing protein
MTPREISMFLYLFSILISIGITLGVGFYTMRRQKVIGARSFAFVLFLEATWTTGYFFETIAPTLEGKIFWDNLQWLPSLFLPLAILSFAWEYAHYKFRRTVWIWGGLAIIPVLTCILIFTNSWHGLAVSAIQFIPRDLFAEYTYRFGNWLWLGIIYVYTITVLGISLLIRHASRHPEIDRIQIGIIVLGFAIPSLGALIGTLDVVALPNRDLSPYTFSIANLLVAIGLFRYRLFDILPFARNLVMENMEDGVMIVDGLGRLLDINLASKKILQISENQWIGQPLALLLPDGWAPIELDQTAQSVHREIRLDQAGEAKIIDLRITRLLDKHNHFAGHMLILRDITAHKLREEDLHRSQNLLEQRVSERTAELATANKSLKAEVEQRRQAEESKETQRREMEILYKLTVELAALPGDADLESVAVTQLRQLIGAYIVTAAVYNPAKKQLELRRMETDSRTLREASRLLGRNVTELAFPVSDALYAEMIKGMIGYRRTLSEATMGAISPTAGVILQKIFDLNAFIGMAVQYQGKLMGSFVLILKSGQTAPSDWLVHALANVLSIVYRRKQAEEALRSSEEKFRSIVEQSSEGVVLVGEDGMVLELNRAFEQIYGMSKTEILGKPFWEMTRRLIYPDGNVNDPLKDAQKDYQNIVQDSLGARTLTEETEFITPDGRRRVIQRIAFPVIVSQGRRMAAVVSDITERKNAEREQRRLNRTLTMISECNHALIRMDDEADLLQTICNIMIDIGGYRFAYIGYIQGTTDQKIEPITVCGAGGNYLQRLAVLEQDPAAQSLRRFILEQIKSSQPVMVNDIRTDTLFAPYRDEALQHGFLSMIVFPLVFGPDLFGSLNIYSGEPNIPDKHEWDLLIEMVNDISFGIHVRRMRIARDHAEQKVLAANLELQRAYASTLEGWSRALELREHETAGHSQRVVALTLAIARKMGIPEEDLIHIQRGALLHDIGKMGIPDSILLKPEALTDEEWEVMRQHAQFAYQLLVGIPYLAPALDIPYCHHEHWDGSGYPRKLKGDEIPLTARIFAVVDVWDALTSNRPYRSAWTEQVVYAYMQSQSGKLFDPRVVEEFLNMIFPSS